MINWFYLSISTIILWGVGEVFTKEATDRLGASNMVLLCACSALVVWIPFWFTVGSSFDIFSKYALAGLISALMSGLAWICYYEALKRGKLSIVGVLVGAFPIVTVVLAWCLLHENPPLIHKISAFLIIIGGMSLLYDEKKVKDKRPKRGVWLMYAVGAMLLWGVSGVITKWSLKELHYANYLLLYTFICTPIWLGHWFLHRPRNGLSALRTNKKALKLGMLSVVMFSLGSITSFYAIQLGLVSVVGPLTSAYVVVMVIFAHVRLHERLSCMNRLAVAMIMISIMLIGYA